MKNDLLVLVFDELIGVAVHRHFAVRPVIELLQQLKHQRFVAVLETANFLNPNQRIIQRHSKVSVVLPVPLDCRDNGQCLAEV